LTSFSGKDNLLTSVDLALNTDLTAVRCENNLLTNLNLKNGNNMSMVSGNFRATNNPNLTCIQVDDASWSTTNWITSIDSQSFFSENCTTSAVDESKTENYFTINPNPMTNHFIIQNSSSYSIDQVSIYNMFGKIVFQSKSSQNNIDVSKFTSGIYLVKILCNKQAITKKIIIE
jgi:hypothetical protein